MCVHVGFESARVSESLWAESTLEMLWVSVDVKVSSAIAKLSESLEAVPTRPRLFPSVCTYVSFKSRF